MKLVRQRIWTLSKDITYIFVLPNPQKTLPILLFGNKWPSWFCLTGKCTHFIATLPKWVAHSLWKEDCLSNYKIILYATNSSKSINQDLRNIFMIILLSAYPLVWINHFVYLSIKSQCFRGKSKWILVPPKLKAESPQQSYN